MPIAEENIKILQNLTGHKSDVATCDIASNFTIVTGSSDKTVRIWDWIPGQGYLERDSSPLMEHKYQVTCVKISPQGSMLATASVDGTAILWSLVSTTKLYTMTQVNGDAVRVCRFAPDSSILVTAGDNGAICVWDLVHRSLIRSIFEHEGTAQALAFTPDSQYLVSACTLETLKVWYVQDLIDTTLENGCSPLARYDNVHDLGICFVDINKTICIDENNPLVKYYTMATCGNSDDIKIWTITSISAIKSKNASNQVTMELQDIYNGHNSSVTCLRYSNCGRYLISSSLDKTIKIWDTDGNCMATLEGHTRYVNCVAISKDSRLIVSGSTGSNDKLVLIWDLTGNLSVDSELFKTHRTSLPNGSITELQLIENNNSNNNKVTFLEKFDDTFDGALNCCCFNCNGVLATASGDKLVRLFKITEDNCLEEMNCSPLEGHTYSVNHVEFSADGALLASCSLDGCTFIWDTMSGEKVASLPENSLAIKICRFSPDGNLLITAGDDDKASIWDASTYELITLLEGHLDAITSASFSPDSSIIVTTSSNEDFRIWQVIDYENIHVQENAHNGGIQDCDFSQNLEPLPNTLFDTQCFLLATCGQDSMVKLWRISVFKKDDLLDYDNLEVKLWRCLAGHGGNVECVRFSPRSGEILCSTATDRQARIWSVYSSECLHVLDHDSIATACSFSFDCSLLAIGCLDKTIWLWKLPQQLVFQNIVANKIKCRTKVLLDWTTHDIIKWLKDISLEEVTDNVQNASLTGEKILMYSEDQICSGLDLNDEHCEKFRKELRWLKLNEMQITKPENIDIPHDFLCPITHEIMREPVTCTDGFTYEKSAIVEWFLSGKYTSPLTNETLIDTEYVYNHELRVAIYSFLDENNE